MTGAVVTTAGGSLGRVLARRLAAGGHVVAVTDADGAGLDQTAGAVRAQGGEARAWPVDLRGFLTGPDASNASGQTIEVNGGWVMS